MSGMPRASFSIGKHAVRGLWNGHGGMVEGISE